jgi:hypothetical protein
MAKKLLKGKTQSGFSFTIDPAKLYDMRFIEALSEHEDMNDHEALMFLPKLLTMVLGDEQKGKLYHHIEKDGFVDPQKVETELGEIFKIASAKNEEVKN